MDTVQSQETEGNIKDSGWFTCIQQSPVDTVQSQLTEGNFKDSGQFTCIESQWTSLQWIQYKVRKQRVTLRTAVGSPVYRVGGPQSPVDTVQSQLTVAP